MPIKNPPSTSPTLNIIDPERKLENNSFSISEALAQISATFSYWISLGSLTPDITNDIIEISQKVEISPKREHELAKLINGLVSCSDNLVRLRIEGHMVTGCTYFNGFNTELEKIKEEENDFLWEKHSLSIKKIIFSNAKHFSEVQRGGLLALDMFFTNYQKRALNEESIKHINIILALNEMTIFPQDIKRYIFGFTKALLENQEPEFAKAFYPAAAFYLNEGDISGITDISNMIEYNFRIGKC